MRSTIHRSLAGPALVLGFLALVSGCAVLDVQMTSMPDRVRGGEPVTFDLKATNRSQCPVNGVLLELLAFIPEDQFDAQFSFGLPPDAPQEVKDFLDQLRAFFDELCAGGTPDFPQPPMFSTSCGRGEGDVVCTMSGALGSHEGSTGSMSLGLLGNQLQCAIDDASVSCQMHFPLPRRSASAQGSGALMTADLNCFTTEDSNGVVFSEGGSGAACIIGSLQNLGGLTPGQMATGQVMLRARGEGFVRNLLFGFAGVEFSGNDVSLGVCKGGSEGGQACNTEDSNSCPGSTCGEGICDAGGNQGKGCDEASAVTDCPGGSCVLCTDVPEIGFLPIDCTTTYVAPETVPTMSPWGLAGLAAILFAAGTLFLRRRGRRA